MKELAIRKNDLAHRIKNGFIATTKIPAVGFSSKLALMVLWEKLEDKKNPIASLELLTRKAGRVRATEENVRKMSRRMPKFRIKLLEDGILLVTQKAGKRSVGFVIYSEDASDTITDWALNEIREREDKCEITKERANEMRRLIKRSKPKAKLVKYTKNETQFLLSFEDDAPQPD